MPRVTPITTKEQVAAEHQSIFDAVAEGRGSVRGPFSIMMYSPEMCGRVLNTSNFLRFQSSVKPKEGELAICATARVARKHASEKLVRNRISSWD